jgi:hypothetical protein
MRIFKIAFIVSSICLLMSCTQDKIVEIPVECPDPISFSQDVEPLFVTGCSTSGCHGAAAAGGYNLEGHSNISTNATPILGVIRHETGTPMPFNGSKWSDADIQTFQCWMDQGKLDN